MPINDKQLTIAIIPLWLKMYDQAFLPAAKPTHPTRRQVRLYHGAPIHRLSPPTAHLPVAYQLPPIPHSASAVQHSDTQKPLIRQLISFTAYDGHGTNWLMLNGHWRTAQSKMASFFRFVSDVFSS